MAQLWQTLLATHGVELLSSPGGDPGARQKICMDFAQGVFQEMTCCAKIMLNSD
jgi:hypothetical protein